MKKSQLKEVIKAIVKQALKENFQVGEWWIDSSGDAQYCDGDVGDVNHEAYIRQILAHEVLNHFGIDGDEGGVEEHADEIKQELYDDGKLSEEELVAWENDPANVMLNKLEAENPFGADKERLHWWFFLAYGSQTTQRGDARDYAMKYMGYKRMVTQSNKAIIQTQTITPKDLQIISSGLSSVWEEDYDNDDEKELGDDGFSGPRVEIEVRSTNHTYHGVPLDVIEKHSPTALRAYLKYRPWMGEQLTLNEGFFRENKAWSVYEGSGHVVAMFEDNSRQTFEICFHNMMGEDKERWRQRAASKWSSVARKLHGDVQLSEAGNPIERSWQECFKEALTMPEMKEFVRNPKHKKVFAHHGYPKQPKNVATITDPVNFTTTG